jgi:hypothetical protein
MAIAFPRSLRALDNDRFRPSLIVLGITLAVLGAMLIWFFFGSVPVTESFSSVIIDAQGLVRVSVPADHVTAIVPSTKATVQVLSDGKVTKTYTGYVTRVEPGNGQPNGDVVVYLGTPERLPESTQVRVSIQTETLSPLAYAVRAVQQSNPAQLNPFAQPAPTSPAP